MWSPANEAQLQEAIAEARNERRTVSVIGHNTKAGYGRPTANTQPLQVAELAGIVDYQPQELLVTVRPGTSVAELEAELHSRQQHLIFEPADWGPLLGGTAARSTIGGTVAAAVSGPRRMKAGAVRDHILGARGVSGLGIAFACGAKVVKNVTGFDLPKLLCGSMGTLAVLSEVTLRVGPRPETELTLILQGLPPHDAIALMRDAAASPQEVSAAAHLPHPVPTTYLRLEGPFASVAERTRSLSRELSGYSASVSWLDAEQSQIQWRSIRDVHCFTGNDRPLWRLMLPPNRAALVVAEIAQNLDCHVQFDRAGALIWLESQSQEAGESWVRTATQRVQGNATLFRAQPHLRSSIPPFHPEPQALGKLSESIKLAYDPQGILEPGRMVRGR